MTVCTVRNHILLWYIVLVPVEPQHISLFNRNHEVVEHRLQISPKSNRSLPKSQQDTSQLVVEVGSLP